MKATVTKLTRLKDPYHKTHPLIKDNETFYGHISFPKLGERFELRSQEVFGSGSLSTSPVKSVYIKGTGQDKLVLPSNFPDGELLEHSNFNLKDGEMLFATQNNIYKVTDLE